MGCGGSKAIKEDNPAILPNLQKQEDNSNIKWRTLLENDNNFDQNSQYCIKSIEEKIDNVTDFDNLNPYFVLSPIYELTKVFGKISSALGMGFKDITKKVNSIRGKFKVFFKTTNSIQEAILKEVKLKLYDLTSENNKERGHEDDQYKDYRSIAIEFLRLLWFLEFIINIFRKIVSEDDKSLKDILKNAYAEVLAPRHSAMVRGAVNVALAFANCKKEEAVLYMFDLHDLSPQSKEVISRIANKLEKIWKAGNQFYIHNNLMHLEKI